MKRKTNKIDRALLVLFKEAEYETKVGFVHAFFKEQNAKIEIEVEDGIKVSVVEHESGNWSKLTKDQTLDSIFRQELDYYDGELPNDVPRILRFARFLRNWVKKAERKAREIQRSTKESTP